MTKVAGMFCSLISSVAEDVCARELSILQKDCFDKLAVIIVIASALEMCHKIL